MVTPPTVVRAGRSAIKWLSGNLNTSKEVFRTFRLAQKHEAGGRDNGNVELLAKTVAIIDSTDHLTVSSSVQIVVVVVLDCLRMS
eukprot:scaffold141056_cov26-Prasinocladus_malaysianus.AAC.1